MTNTDYWEEIKSIACEVEQAYQEDDTIDIYDTVWEHVNGHQWVIYYSYNLEVLQHSDNPENMIEEFGGASAGDILKSQGLSSLHSELSFWAMKQDILDNINN